jgi:protein phosphatase
VHPHRNLILRAVDGVHEPEPDVFVQELAVGDRVLLCSDGCSGALEDEQLAALLGGGPVERASVELVRAALEAGSSDNVTVVVAEVVDEAEDAEAPPARPLVVGAAAEVPRRGFGLLRGRRATDTGELEPVPGEGLDPEALRYAPREPRRFVWLRRIGIALLVLAVLCGLGIAAYAWTQTQYFVGAADRDVAVYQGVEADVPGLRMHHVLETSSLRLDQLPAYNARQVRDGIGAQSLADARAIIDRLRNEAFCPPTPTPSPTPTPTHRASKKAGHKPGGTKSSRPRRTATASASPSASPTASPTGGSHRHCTERP